MTLSYVSTFKVLPMTREDNCGLMICKLTLSLTVMNITPNTQVISRKS